MNKQLTPKQISTIYRMVDFKHPVEHIAVGMGLNISTIYRHLRFRQEGIKSNEDYLDYLARRKGFENHLSYDNYRAVLSGFNSSSGKQKGISKKKEITKKI
jgi:hypothetical protein